MPQVQRSTSSTPTLSADANDPSTPSTSHSKIVSALLHHLASTGFRVRGVLVDGRRIACADFSSAIQHALGAGDTQILVQKEGFGERSVTLDGSSAELITDWSSIPGDRDSFDAVMVEFEPGEFA